MGGQNEPGGIRSLFMRVQRASRKARTRGKKKTICSIASGCSRGLWARFGVDCPSRTPIKPALTTKSSRSDLYDRETPQRKFLSDDLTQIPGTRAAGATRWEGATLQVKSDQPMRGGACRKVPVWHRTKFRRTRSDRGSTPEPRKCGNASRKQKAENVTRSLDS